MKTLWCFEFRRSRWLLGMVLSLPLLLGQPAPQSVFAGTGEQATLAVRADWTPWTETAPNTGDTDVESSKRVDTTFQVQPGLRVDLRNRYGNVSVTTWERNEARVQIEVRVRESDAESAQEALDRISLYQVAHGSLLRLETALNSERSGFKKFWEDFAGFNKIAVDVEYQLTLPAYTELRLANEFGDVYLEGLTGPMQIDMGYGNLRMRTVPDNSRIQLEGGRATLGQASFLRMMLEDAEVELREVTRLELDSKSSELRIEQVDDLRWTSKRDHARILRVGTINATGHFSDLVVEELLDVGDFDWTLGRLDIEQLGSYLQELSLSHKNADVEINVEGLDFDLQAYLEGGKLIAPKELGELDVNLLDVKREIRTITTRFGDGRSRIELEGKGGQVALFR